MFDDLSGMVGLYDDVRTVWLFGFCGGRAVVHNAPYTGAKVLIGTRKYPKLVVILGTLPTAGIVR
jgi:hypothetical protein